MIAKSNGCNIRLVGLCLAGTQCLTHGSERNDFTVSDLKPLAWFTALSLSLPFTLSFCLSFPSHCIASHRSDRFWQRHPKTRVSNKLLLVDKSDAILLWDYDVCTHRVGFIGHACTAMLVIPAFPAPAVFYSARIPSVFATRADLCARMVARFLQLYRRVAKYCETNRNGINEDNSKQENMFFNAACIIYFKVESSIFLSSCLKSINHN